MSKYKSKKVEVDGHTFDSKKEAKRYVFLSALESEGIISNLECQKEFELIPAQRIDGKCVERSCKYIADFYYRYDGAEVVEDVKGYRKGTAYSVFVIKRKLMLQKYGIKILEV